MGGAVFPPCWLFGLRCPSTGVCKLWGWGQVLRKWWPPGGLMPMSTSQICCHQCLCPCNEPQLPTASTGDPPLLAQSSRPGPVSYEVSAFSLGPGAHETLCACSKSRVSVSPSPVEFQWSSPAGLQSQILWDLLLPLPDPQAGEPDVGLSTFAPVGELLWYNYFPVCGLPTWQVWDMILSWLHPSYHLTVASSLSLDVGYLFFFFN